MTNPAEMSAAETGPLKGSDGNNPNTDTVGAGSGEQPPETEPKHPEQETPNDSTSQGKDGAVATTEGQAETETEAEAQTEKDSKGEVKDENIKEIENPEEGVSETVNDGSVAVMDSEEKNNDRPAHTEGETPAVNAINDANQEQQKEHHHENEHKQEHENSDPEPAPETSISPSERTLESQTEGVNNDDKDRNESNLAADKDVDEDDNDVGLNPLDGSHNIQETPNPDPDQPTETSRDAELKVIGGEILFQRTPINGWDNLRWMSLSGVRKVQSCHPVYRFAPGRKTLFWSGNQYVERRLAIYSDPSIILVLRAPENAAEVNTILDLPSGSKVAADDPKSLSAYLVVESVIDSKTCKLRLSPLTTVTSVHEGVKLDDFRRRSCFEIITPAEKAVFSAVRLRKGAERSLTSFTDSGAFAEALGVEFRLKKAICASHHQGDSIESYSDLSWQHQVILGTLHSIVISGNHKFLEQALLVAKMSTSTKATESGRLDAKIIDAPDENGHTPLYYACKKRSNAAVALLVKYGANVNLRTRNQMTFTHLCARNLDEKSISALLSSGNAELNARDGLGRTATFIAIVEGHTVGGKRDSESLDRCLTTLKTLGESLMEKSLYMHPLGILSSQWRADDARTLLKHTRFRFPLSSADRSSTGISLGALYHYPLHLCLIALRKKIFAACTGDTSEVEHLKEVCAANESDFTSTLQIFLRHGFEPNERIEGILNPFDGADDLAEHTGMTPLQILSAAAIDASELKAAVDERLFVGIMKHVSDAADTLMKSGARTTMDAPPVSRSPNRPPGFACLQRMEGVPAKYFPIDRAGLKISSNKMLEGLLDFERLRASQGIWKSVQKVNYSNRAVIQRDNKSPIDVSNAPGGNDDRTCAVCWSTFGTLTNRRHRCRLTRRHICDECSSKRMSDHGEEYRISDGQFLLARADASVVESERLQAQKQKNMADEARRSQAAARFDQLEREEREKRESLFGSVMGGMAKAVFGEDEDDDVVTRTSNDIGGLSSALGQTRDRLNERGEKLNTLAEKSDKLVNASRDFAAMAKELNKKSSSFW